MSNREYFPGHSKGTCVCGIRVQKWYMSTQTRGDYSVTDRKTVPCPWYNKYASRVARAMPCYVRCQMYRVNMPTYIAN